MAGTPRDADGPGPDDVDGTDAELISDAEVTASQVTSIVAGGTFVGLHLLVGALILSLGTVTPPGPFTGLLVVWIALAVVGWRGRRTRPIRTMLVPFVAAGAAIAAVSAGTAWLGWGP